MTKIGSSIFGLRLFLLVLLSICAIEGVQAQAAVSKSKGRKTAPTVLTGSIIRSDYCGIPNSSVSLCDSQGKPLGRVVVSDSNGHFSIDLGAFTDAEKRNLHLIASATGFNTSSATVGDNILRNGITIRLFGEREFTIYCGFKGISIEELSPPPVSPYAHSMEIKYLSRREELRTWRRRFFRVD